MADHTLDITVNINLGAAPLSQAGFNAVLLLVDLATNTMNGDRVRAYSTPTDISSDETAGYISAATSNTLTAMLSQRPRPSEVLLGHVDLVGGETYSDGLAAVRLERDDFWAVVMNDQTAATQVALGTTIESLDKLLILQSSDADWITTGVPAGYSTVDGNENTAVLYHDTATVYADAGWAVKGSIPDPDRVSGPWAVPLKGVTAYATALTSAERGFLVANNANHMAAMGPEPFFVSRGVNMNGRPIHEILTAHWLKARIQEDLSTLIADYGARNRKLPTNAEGMAVAVGTIKSRLLLAEDADHIDDFDIPQQTITTADRDAGRLTISDVRAVMPNTTVQFTITIDASRTPLAEA